MQTGGVDLLALQASVHAPPAGLAFVDDHLAVQQSLVPRVQPDVESPELAFYELLLLPDRAAYDDAPSDLPRPAGTTEPVNVRLAILRTTELYHVRHVRIIDPPCRHVRGEEHALGELAKFVRDHRAVVLILLRMYLQYRYAIHGIEHVGEEFAHGRGGEEDDDFVIRGVPHVYHVLDDVHESGDESAPGGDAVVVVVFDDAGRRREGDVGLIDARIRVTRRIDVVDAVHGEVIFPHVTRHDRPKLLGEGRREQQRLGGGLAAHPASPPPPPPLRLVI